MASTARSDHLAELVDRLEQEGWAAELWDPEWRLLWVSPELKASIGEHDEERLGYGRHYLECRLNEAWQKTVTRETFARALAGETPFMVEDTPGGKDEIARIVRQALGEDFGRALEELEPVPPPPVWRFAVDFVQGSLPPVRIHYTAARIRDDAGALLGTLMVWGYGLRSDLLALVARGDEGMFARMARLTEPGRHRSAVLFADLQSSAALSRQLSSASYFELIRSFTTQIDALVVERSGIVGKHVGDGVTAFFLADDLGSVSAAARAALDTGREIAATGGRVREQLSLDGDLAAEDCLVNVGLHWGGALYMGQVVTGGRLEVTALGDEVNEAARIQQSARDGAVLASKSLLECLEPGDARALDLDPDGTRYTMLADLDGATDKARRDAGSVAVTKLTP